MRVFVGMRARILWGQKKILNTAFVIFRCQSEAHIRSLTVSEVSVNPFLHSLAWGTTVGRLSGDDNGSWHLQ